jgi:choline kinase
MKVIILSAGQGRRLLPLTENKPKCALDVGGLSMLEAQLQQIAACAVDEVVVVTGFRADHVDGIVANSTLANVRTLYNPFYALSDNLGTCWVAAREMQEPFVILNGDTLFEASVMTRLLASPADSAITLAIDRKAAYDDDDMKVVVDGGQLRRVGKRLTDGVNGESIGMMVFSGDGPGLFTGTVERMMRDESGTKRWYLSAIDEIARTNTVHVCDIAGSSWCEVDDAADLENARRVVASWYADPVEARA